MRSIYSDVIEIIISHENTQWEIGDKLLSIVGSDLSGNHGEHDGSRAILEEIANEVDGRGIEGYSASYLAELRLNSWRFPREARASHVSWKGHKLAGSPEMLAKIIARAKQEKVAKLTTAYIKDARAAIEAGAPKAEKVIKAIVSCKLALAEAPNADISFENGQEERDMYIKMLHELRLEISARIEELGSPRSHIKVVR